MVGHPEVIHLDRKWAYLPLATEADRGSPVSVNAVYRPLLPLAGRSDSLAITSDNTAGSPG
jgi:hypothetical protein